jgi:uracil-DNA glycosylase
MALAVASGLQESARWGAQHRLGQQPAVWPPRLIYAWTSCMLMVMHEQARDPDRARRLRVYQEDASACARCHEPGHLFVDPVHGTARPILARSPTGALGVLIVGEAPNYGDTFDPAKGYLTYDPETDPTGRFMRSLLIDEAGLLPHEVDDILFSNTVLCLPRRRNGKHPVSTRQIDACKPWLVRLIQDADITIVVTMGAVALGAVGRIERHGLTLARDAGRVHAWYGRKLLPLYHAGLLGRISRKEALQRADMRALRDHLGR